MLESAQSFMRELDAIEWGYRPPRELESGKVVITCGINGKVNKYDMTFIFDEDGKTMGVRVFQLVKVPIDKKLQVMELVNQLNISYRWIKFLIDKEDNVDLQADSILRGENTGKVGVELMVHMFKIIDEVYPKFMRTIWAD